MNTYSIVNILRYKLYCIKLCHIFISSNLCKLSFFPPIAFQTQTWKQNWNFRFQATSSSFHAWHSKARWQLRQSETRRCWNWNSRGRWQWQAAFLCLAVSPEPNHSRWHGETPFPISKTKHKHLRLILGTRERWLRAILILNLFDFFLMDQQICQYCLSALLQYIHIKSYWLLNMSSETKPFNFQPSFCNLTGQHILKFKATFIAIFQRCLSSLCQISRRIPSGSMTQYHPLRGYHQQPHFKKMQSIKHSF